MIDVVGSCKQGHFSNRESVNGLWKFGEWHALVEGRVV